MYKIKALKKGIIINYRIIPEEFLKINDPEKIYNMKMEDLQKDPDIEIKKIDEQKKTTKKKY